MLSNFLNIFKRDSEYGEPVNLQVKNLPDFEYPLSFEDWVKEFGVSSKYEIDTNTEHDIKVMWDDTNKVINNLLSDAKEKELTLRIQNAQLYNRSNQNKYIR